jgi:hypothetical protein
MHPTEQTTEATSTAVTKEATGHAATEKATSPAAIKKTTSQVAAPAIREANDQKTYVHKASVPVLAIESQTVSKR